MAETIVAVYDTSEHAALAVHDLEAAGVPSSAISQHASSGVVTGSITSAAPVHEEGFWASLFGGEPEYEHDTTVYDRSLEGGSTVVTVKAPEQHLTQVVEILERHNPIDLDERAASYGLGAGGTTATAANRMATAAPTASGIPSGRGTTSQQDGQEVVPLSEEQLTVGKRLVNRGTTRVRRFVVAQRGRFHQSPARAFESLSITRGADAAPAASGRTHACKHHRSVIQEGR
jgi:hypothetical protein